MGFLFAPLHQVARLPALNAPPFDLVLSVPAANQSMTWGDAKNLIEKAWRKFGHGECAIHNVANDNWKAVNAACQHYVENGSWPQLDPRARMLLCNRLFYAYEEIRSHDPRDEVSPAMTDMELLKHLLSKGGSKYPAVT
ncbi:MAG: hypothetical protein JWQ71_1276 [Pedosphaera sp.]|nr:hypothetical protein [Pedosphaera sp.]